ncbi:MAG: hypothetical protein LBJ37_16825 [Paucimonas sp.]|nr:hypothetical protein [Paucimonas sp.]
MSHLSPDRFIAVLGASGVGLGQRRAGTSCWLGSVGFIGEGFHGWSVALDTLDLLLAEHTTAGARLDVVVSAHFSRFCLVPWSEQINHPEELQGFARLCFEDLYGVAEQAWDLVLSAEAAGHDRIAAALPRALLERLRGLASNHDLRLRSVQPYLMAAFNRFGAQLGSDDFLFVVAEPLRSVLLLAREGRWTAVRSVGGSDNDTALTALIGRESQLQACASDRQLSLYLHAPGRVEAPPQVPGVTLCGLEDAADGVRDSLYAMCRAVA